MCKEIFTDKIKNIALFLTLSFVIIVSAIFGCNFTAEAADEPSVKFVQEYAEPNEYLDIKIEGIENEDYTISWIIDGVTVSNEHSYIPSYYDLEKFISVFVVSESGKKLASNRIFCSKLPVIYIDTEGGVPVTTKETYIDAEITVQGNSLYSSNNCDLYSGATEIKGRGNSTWLRFPKKPYRLKLDKKADLFGLGKNKHWALLANYIDDTMMRNSLAGDIAQQLDCMKMDGVSVDLIFNGEHVGNYLLIEHVRLDSKRVDVFDWVSLGEDIAAEIVKKNNLTDDDEDELAGYMEENLGWITSGVVTYKGVTYKVADYSEDEIPEANGGFLIEMDISMDEVSCFYTNIETPIMIKDPEFVNTNDTMFNYIKTYINEFESAAYSVDHTTTINGKKVSYTDYADIYSMVRYWLTSEMLCNEIGFKSTYVHKDVNEKMEFGPIWDFDFSSGGVAPFGTQSSTAWITKTRRWFSDIMKDPYFAVKVRELFVENEDYFNNLVSDGGTLDQWYEYLYESGVKNTEIWHFSRGFEEDFKVLKNWLTTRINWISDEFATDVSALASFGVTTGGSDINLSSSSLLAKQDNAYYISDKSNSSDKITVNIENTDAVSYNYYVNSKYIGSGNINNKKGSFTVDKSFLTENNGTKNVIVVRTKDASGNFVGLQFITITVVPSDSKFFTVTFNDGLNSFDATVLKGEKIYLDTSDYCEKANIFSCWTTDDNNSYVSNKYFTVNENTVFTASYKPCTGNSISHNFMENENYDYVCTECKAEKASDKTFIDVSSLTFNQTNRYNINYTGEKVAPEIFVYNGDETLVEGKHYTLEIINNINEGYATYTITGLRSGGYDGVTQLCYRIIPAELKTVSGGVDNSKPYDYTGSPVKPVINLSFNGKTLVEGVDYYISSISNNVNTGTNTAKITITGMGNFTGSKSYSFSIEGNPVESPSLTLSENEFDYTGTEIKPKAIVSDAAGNSYKEGTDYTVEYKDNINAGKGTVTIRFRNNYSGTVTSAFTINAISSEPLKVSLNKTSFTATGEKIKPTVTVKDKNGKIVASSNYTVAYKKNINAGKATAEVKFKGNYYGSEALNFTIKLAQVTNLKATAKTTSLKLSWKKVPAATSYQIYFYNSDKGKYVLKTTVKTNSATVKNLTSSKKYKIKVRAVSKKNGTVYGSYSKALNTATKPKTAKITAYSSSKANTVYLKWNTVTSATGYQVWYSTSKNGTYKKLTSTKNKSVNYKSSNLKKGKTYYFKVRAYKTISSGNHQMGAFSSAVKVRIK